MYNNSDSSIYHFTKNIESLISILDNGFYPHICEEDMSIVLPNYDKMTVGIPMVCFTDIPLVQSEGRTGLTIENNRKDNNLHIKEF